jgi:hypothetical protein
MTIPQDLQPFPGHTAADGEGGKAVTRRRLWHVRYPAGLRADSWTPGRR